ncbi:MAG: polysaccharide biosynthesis C-terminal domain-containing protein [Bacteroidetes bacterium]|nr:polysaccharide biosynthesis C-terminal domain-containing protein [Bacteroidota bacterium]
MGIVQNQAFKNTIITYFGFGIGAINVLFLYTEFLTPEYFGLITFILSTANIMMPLMAFGVHNAIIKFYSSFKTKNKQNSFLTLMLFLPLTVIIPFGLVGYLSFDVISTWLSKENIIIKDYTWLIFISAIAFAYFEVFYSWSKVQLHTVFGNFMKEVFHRIGITILLVCLYYNYITVNQLIYGIVGVYILRMLIMKLYAYNIKWPVLKFHKLGNTTEILKYAALIIIAGSVANIILEIDKFMIGKYIMIENVAYYGVAIYIATVIGVPARSMHQITNPLTAKLLNEKNNVELKSLYQKSSLNLFIISGIIFVLILANLNQLYTLMPMEYRGGLVIVLVIGLAKLFDNLIGNNNAILFNSDYYRVVLSFGVVLTLLTVVLNIIFIPRFGIEGAAYATFIAMCLYNCSKIVFVKYKFKMQPFTINTAKTFVLLLVLIVAFYFWEFSFHPIVNIILKSILISLCYVFVVYRFNLSEDITAILNKLLNKR